MATTAAAPRQAMDEQLPRDVNRPPRACSSNRPAVPNPGSRVRTCKSTRHPRRRGHGGFFLGKQGNVRRGAKAEQVGVSAMPTRERTRGPGERRAQPDRQPGCRPHALRCLHAGPTPVASAPGAGQMSCLLRAGGLWRPCLASLGSVFPTAVARSVPRGRGAAVPATFKTFSLVSFLLCGSVVGDM